MLRVCLKSFAILLILFHHAQAIGHRGFGPGEQDYGYVTVREGAHMFWWLFHTSANVTNSHTRPLIVWLSGGPGASSCGIGNFAVIGPIDENLNLRNTTWVKDFNILFVDAPVGTGFSYVDNIIYLAKNNSQIARDMVVLMRGFYDKLPQFRRTPLYVHGDGYGSNYAADFVRLLYREDIEGRLESNVKAMSAGSGWISPLDETLSYSAYLYQLGLVDETSEAIVHRQAEFVVQRFDEGKFYHATLEWSRLLEFIFVLADGIDFSNVAVKYKRPSRRDTAVKNSTAFVGTGYESEDDTETLTKLMNGDVKAALDIPEHVKWELQSVHVYENLVDDFMQPVTESIESILNETNIDVHIVNGNLNLLTSTPGQLSWVNGLVWRQSGDFQNANRTTVWVDDVMEGYVKQGGRLAFHWVNVAGLNFYHENPKATREFLRTMTGV